MFVGTSSRSLFSCSIKQVFSINVSRNTEIHVLIHHLWTLKIMNANHKNRNTFIMASIIAYFAKTTTHFLTHASDPFPPPSIRSKLR